MTAYHSYIVVIETPDGDEKYLDVRAQSDRAATKRALALVAKRGWSPDWFVSSTTRLS